MPPKEGKTKDGKPVHYSVGALIKRDGRYLLIDRTNIPFGFAGLAGHIDEGEDELTAVEREVKEESGLTIVRSTLLFEEELDWNRCGRNVSSHYWYLFACDVSGEPVLDPEEAVSMGWYTPEEIKKLVLEPAWEYWFKKLDII